VLFCWMCTTLEKLYSMDIRVSGRLLWPKQVCVVGDLLSFATTLLINDGGDWVNHIWNHGLPSDGTARLNPDHRDSVEGAL
jgi:hypothetical protein